MSGLYFFANLGWSKATAVKIMGAVGVGGLLSAATWGCRKLFVFGKIIQRLDTVEKDIKEVKKEVRSASKDLIKRVDDLMIAVAQTGLTEAHSPRQLASEGLRILRESGINSIVDDRFDLIVRRVAEQHPENAYQAERSIIEVVRHLADNPAIRDAVEEGAFNSGSLAPAVLYVGAIYIRDRVLQQLGLRTEEIDQHVPKPKGKS